MKRSLLAIALLSSLSFAAVAADGVSYTYVQGGYVATNTDSGDAQGWGVSGSAAFHPNFHVFGDFANQEIDDTDVDFDQWRVGGGYNHQISQNADLLTRVAYEKFDAGSGIGSDGHRVEARVRGRRARRDAAGARGLCPGRLRGRRRVRRRLLRPLRRAVEVQPELGPQRRRQGGGRRHPVVRGSAPDLVTQRKDRDGSLP